MQHFKLLLLTGITALALICFMILTSCSGGTPDPVENADGTVTWNGWTLTRSELLYPYYEHDLYSDIVAQPNVLTKDKLSLSLVLERRYKHSPNFGSNVQIQVLLNGQWYLIPKSETVSNMPFVLPALKKKEKLQTPVEYEADLAGVIDLPPGAYRFTEEALETPDGNLSTWYARFWIIKPGAKAPLESLTQGKARLQNIILSVDSSYPVQRAIITEDDMFTVVAENLSGKTYKPIFENEEDDGIILERLTDGKWMGVPYAGANSHTWVWGWGVSRLELFVYYKNSEDTGYDRNTLESGRYRVRFPMKTDAGGLIEPSCEFDVLMPEDAPPPEWNMDELRLSEYEGREPSSGIIMKPLHSTLNGNDALQEVEFTVNGQFGYGPQFGMEIYLDDRWYTLPFADARGFEQPLYHIDQSNTGKTEKFNLKSSFGLLPEGKYRLVREYLNKENGNHEYISAEFTVVND